MTGRDEAWVVLERLLSEAARDFEAVAGGRSACAIGRSGQSFPAAKYHEGAMNALAEVRRRSSRDDAPDIAGLTREVLMDWQGRFGRFATIDPEWRAYLAGATEALEALEQELADGRE